MSRSRNELSRLRDDPYLAPYAHRVNERRRFVTALEHRLTLDTMPIEEFACGHEYYGMHRREGRWVFREWAPNAETIHLVGTFSDWQPLEAFRLNRVSATGDWELWLDGSALRHGDLYRLAMRWPGGAGDRIPAYARRVVQDPHSLIFNAQIWNPPEPYAWRHAGGAWIPAAPLIYESHVGMAQEREGVGTYDEFREKTIPRIAAAGYNTIQLMAVMEHPYYGSFGYHVSSYFAASSRFGTPDELKALIDTAHGAGLAVIMDLVHSHAATNEAEGLSRFDGTRYQYFHDGDRGDHPAWGSRCFDYGKPEVLHLLLSNCRFWLDEYRVDGFRFDGVTSMLYHHHGLGPAFLSYDTYFDDSVDLDAYGYLALANRVVHRVNPHAMTIAEDVSGMPGLGAPLEEGGCDFDYRLAMGLPDFWFKLVRTRRDEDWDMQGMWHELTNRRRDERTVSYVESHDQAIVGSKTMMFELADAAMYGAMTKHEQSLVIDRAVALHKMIRLATFATAGHGYLNFMGNEFGHPEWIDFPREGNHWSYHYARRQWHLRDDPDLRYHYLADFDSAMLRLFADGTEFVRRRPALLCVHNDDKVLAFERAGLCFLFNFHPGLSLVSYRLPMPEGVYELALSTDETRFGGHARVADRQLYHTLANPDEHGGAPAIHVYLPCRCALVLRKVS